MEKFRWKLKNAWIKLRIWLDRQVKRYQLTRLNRRYNGKVPEDVLGAWLTSSTIFMVGLADYTAEEERSSFNLVKACGLLADTSRILAVRLMDLSVGRLLGDVMHQRVESDEDMMKLLYLLDSPGDEAALIGRFVNMLLIEGDIQEHQVRYITAKLSDSR